MSEARASRLSGLDVPDLARKAIITVISAYVLLAGGTLNGLALYDVVSVSLVILSLIGFSWLGSAWSCGRPLHLPRATWAYTIFLVAYGFSALLSLDPRRSCNALVLKLLYGFVWVLVADLLARKWSARVFVRIILLVGTIVIGLALWQTIHYYVRWLTITSGDILSPPRILRPNPLLTNTNMVAAFLNLLWPLAFVKSLTSESRLKRLVAGGWTALSWLVLLLTSSRGGWVGAAVALPVLLVLTWLVDREGQPLKLRAVCPGSPAGWMKCAATLLVIVAGLGGAASFVLRYTSHTPGFDSRRRFWVTAWRAFVAHPLVGLGPDTYATAYLQYASVPPKNLYVRAHSQLVHLVAENGLLGLVSAAALVTAVVYGSWRRWQDASPALQYVLAGVVGALVATTVHGVFDTPGAIPVNALIIAVWSAILTAKPAQLQPRAPHAVAHKLVLTSLLLILVGVGAWSQYAYSPYLEGINLVSRGRWSKAVQKLETAVARDPGHALYRMGSGFAHGMIVHDGDGESLSMAIEHYHTAIRHEPGFALNHANLAALYWQQGDWRAALASIEKAVATAPQEATFWLNLGRYQEELGDLREARRAYERVLDLRERWADAFYWRENEFRSSVLNTWRNSSRGLEPKSRGEQALRALATSRYGEALRLYNEGLGDDRAWAAGHAGRAHALMELGRYGEASRSARIAIFLAGTQSVSNARSRWILAQIAYRQGDLETALTLGNQALKVYRAMGIGPGGRNEATLYPWAVFYRLGPPDLVLPQVTTIGLTDEPIEWLMTLGTWYEKKDDLDEASRAYSEVLKAAPDVLAAKKRLELLGAR